MKHSEFWSAVDTVFGEIMWITNADYPGGSGAYLAAYAAVWYQTMGTAATVLLSFLSDSLLVLPLALLLCVAVE